MLKSWAAFSLVGIHKTMLGRASACLLEKGKFSKISAIPAQIMILNSNSRWTKLKTGN